MVKTRKSIQFTEVTPEMENFVRLVNMSKNDEMLPYLHKVTEKYF